ncbi:MAG: CRISPR-associated protein Cas4 [Halanaerobiales bacterium]
MINLISAMANGMPERGNWDNSSLHVSDLGVNYNLNQDDRKCPRQVWYRLNGYDKEETGPGVSLMFEQGHNLEEKVIEWLRRGIDKGKVVGEQLDVSAGIQPLNGRLDVLIEYEGKYMVVDVKSRRGASFDYVNEIRPSNKMQVAGYIYALRNIMKLPIENGAIIEVDRNGQRFARDFHFQYDRKLEKEVEETIDFLKIIKYSDTPPKKLKPKIKINNNKGADSVVAKLPWQCSYCDYRGVSCPGAIPPKFNDDLGKVVGHIKDSQFEEKVTGIGEYIGELI